MGIASKHIVITGGASGIGLELVRQLYMSNEISIIARPSFSLESLRCNFEHIKVYEADFADLNSVEAAASLLAQNGKKIDILINNAAVQHTPQFLDDSFQFQTIKQEIDVNFTSICILIYLLVPNLLQSNPSIILNINSGLSLVPKTNSAIYCATKGALNILSQSLEYQFENTNIRIKQAFLPLVDTPMTAGRGKGKLPVEKAAADIIKAICKSGSTIDIGKVQALRFLQRLSPSLAKKIMKAGKD